MSFLPSRSVLIFRSDEVFWEYGLDFGFFRKKDELRSSLSYDTQVEAELIL